MRTAAQQQHNQRMTFRYPGAEHSAALYKQGHARHTWIVCSNEPVHGSIVLSQQMLPTMQSCIAPQGNNLVNTFNDLRGDAGEYGYIPTALIEACHLSPPLDISTQCDDLYWICY